MRPTPSTRAIATAASLNMLVVLPVSLLGALAVLIRSELRFSETQLGAAASTFVAVAAIGSVPGGWVAQRIGGYRAMSIVAVVNGVALLGIATLASTYAQLVAWLALAGLANALATPSTTVAILARVSQARMGLAFGIKQSCGPIAAVLGGLAVPALGLTVGWRWAFAAAGGGAMLFLLLVPHRTTGQGPRRVRVASVKSAVRGLIIVAMGAGFATAARSGLGAFYVESAVADGLSIGAAGLWLAAGSAAAIVVHVRSGWLADRRRAGDLRTVAQLITGGAVGFAILAVADHPIMLAAGTLLAFGSGWGWPGLFHFAVALEKPKMPATATGIVMTGVFVGSSIGPLTFGAIVESTSYSVAWWTGAASLLVGSVVIRLGWRVLIWERSMVDITRRGTDLPNKAT